MKQTEKPNEATRGKCYPSESGSPAAKRGGLSFHEVNSPTAKVKSAQKPYESNPREDNRDQPNEERTVSHSGSHNLPTRQPRKEKAKVRVTPPLSAFVKGTGPNLDSFAEIRGRPLRGGAYTFKGTIWGAARRVTGHGQLCARTSVQPSARRTSNDKCTRGAWERQEKPERTRRREVATNHIRREKEPKERGSNNSAI